MRYAALAINLSNLITEELLMNETYDSTRTAIIRLKDSNIIGLLKCLRNQYRRKLCCRYDGKKYWKSS
ncbi:MAG: hypothetical protein H7A23_25025 [Leptospiraceae bacterium]|nr:hypothetical protein [Leptospiraceae bacterium]